MLNDPGRVLMTIEDPVEYQIQGINQVEMSDKSGLSFARGLRTILRSDPDVLLVGEVRDEETARIAMQAGHDRPPRAHDSCMRTTRPARLRA